jgi:catechol 2,3-dioxygenase-like lactoylglutathione lyase family enzyme
MTMMKSIDRRGFLLSLPALAIAPAVLRAQAPQLKVRGINHVTLRVPDVKKSVDFYQGVFGMPVAARQGKTFVGLRVGAGPQTLGFSSGAPDAPATIDHYCVGVENFNVDRIVTVLAEHGIAKSDTRAPNKVLVTMRGPDENGAPAGTPEVHVIDPDGLDIQLQDPGYCGGAGPLGSVCKVEATQAKGLIALRGMSHLTMFVPDATKANAFYRGLFGASIRSYQGPTAPTIAVGPGVEFLMFTGGGGGRAGAAPAPPRPASINHYCMNLDHFNVEQIQKALESAGVKPRESQTGPVGPMRHYVSMRMENRGGAKEGTPELYFTDPDGILVQLQDSKYCGGSGVLGDSCPPL